MVRIGADPTVAVTHACQQCGAGLAFEGVRTETCPYCASPNFIARPQAAGQPEPRFVVAFAGDAAWARRQLARWLGGLTMFADPALSRAKIEDLRGVYLPSYLYSAVARTDYTVSIGEHYTEIETYTVTDAQGKTRTETRTVTRTEYRPLSGQHLGYVTDVIVSASAGLDNATLQAVEPYDLRRLRRFSPAVVTGWIHEEFSRDADECRRLSHDEAVELLGDRLRAFMPGDGFSDLHWRTTVDWETLDPILVPVWVFAVRYRPDRPPLRVVINGQTGKIAGKVPLAWWKIALAVLVGATLIVALVLLARGGA